MFPFDDVIMVKYIHENVFENIVCEMTAIFSGGDELIIIVKYMVRLIMK